MASFAPKSNRPAQSENTDSKPFVAIIPEDGLQVVQIGLLAYLGEHKKHPKFASTNGKREQDENGEDKILWPKEGKDTEQRVGVYVDLLSQTHDFGEDIGVKNIRLPLHQVSRGMSEGVNFTTVAPRTPDGDYIKGKPWLLASTSNLYKIAGVTQIDKETKVSDVIFKADYKNKDLNNINLLLGKPFMFNLDVKVEKKEDNTYVNTKLKSPVPMMKGMAAPDALSPAISITFDDEDLLEEREDLGGVAKIDLLRVADLRRIVLATDYAGTKMQEAIQERFDEDELIKKAKEIDAKIIETDKDLIEIRAKFPNGPDGGEAPAPVKAEGAKPKTPIKPKPPAEGGAEPESPF
jgi:hypothetical protein